MSKKWLYADGEFARIGTMICDKCGGKIVLGMFRYKDARGGFYREHERCSPDDPQWKQFAQAKEAAERFEQARRAAYLEFVKEWGCVADLVDEGLWWE